MIVPWGLTSTTDHGAITAVLDRFLAADPVSGTTLGTVRGTLTDSAWAAFDTDRLAVRSQDRYPVVLAGRWAAHQGGEVAALLRGVPRLAEMSGPGDVVAATVLALGVVATRRMDQRLYRCDELVEPSSVVGRATAADASHFPLVRDWFAAFDAASGGTPGFDPEQGASRALEQGACWLWLDGADVPVAMAARRAIVFGSARIGPVYTPPAQRGHGYGSAATAAATRSILDERAVPVLFTDLANPTSNKIYQLLGYRAVENRLVVNF